jgi:uroporphyrinogen decarboxylase
MLTSRELVKNAVHFKGMDRLPILLTNEHNNDFVFRADGPSPDYRPHCGTDEWGCVWENIGSSNLGEVKDYPLKEWSDFDKIKIPNVESDPKWDNLKNARKEAGDKFLFASGCSLFERIHFLRGLENTWTDIYEEPEQIEKIIDILVNISMTMIRKYASLGFDGYFFTDDWGLQNSLMISPNKWRELWKPAYKRVFDYAKRNNIITIMHSCGNTIEILSDLIEVGLDVIQYQQQENMGIDNLSKYAGKITFLCPIDIQTVMVNGTEKSIRAYTRQLVKSLGTINGGFIANYYGDPVGAGHSKQAVESMCDEFLKISDDISKGLFF